MTKKKKTEETLSQFGKGFKDILITAATHPTTAALAVMTLTVIGQIINGNPSPKDKRRWEIRSQLGGLYNGAQSLGVASAVAPVVVGALGVAKSGIEAFASRPIEVEV